MTAYSKTITGLTNGQAYIVQVSAVNGLYGPGPWSTAITVTPTYDGAALINYVRQLTGVFSKDILSDDLILFWLNEAYSELGRSYNWSWLPVVPLTLTTSPKFDADFATILAYRVAPRVLELEADDSPRAAAYTKEYERMLSNMYKHLLPALGASQPTTMDELVVYVRMLLDEYTFTIDNATIQNMITTCHDDIVASESWKFTSTSFPKMGWELSRVLAYAAAERLGRMLDKPENTVAFYTQEFINALDQVRLAFQVDHSSRANSAEALVYQARTFLGDYGKKVSDSLLKTWLFEEYQNICAERPWTWLQRTEEFTLGPTLEVTLATPHVKLHEVTQVKKTPANLITESLPAVLVPSVATIQYNDPTMYYAFDNVSGKLKFGPTDAVGKIVIVRYEIMPFSGTNMPTTIDGSTGNTFAAFAIPDRYVHVLAYRVAARAAIAAQAPKALYDMITTSSAALYDAMYNEYQLSYTQEPFQLGGHTVESRKYVPWFRSL